MGDDELLNLLDRLLKLTRETEWIEFKHNNNDPEEIGEYLSALANSACLHSQKHGYLIFGIADTTVDLVGTTFKPFTNKVKGQELQSWLTEHLDPKTNFDIYEFIALGKPIIIFQIDAALNTPIKFKDIAYIRIGTYKKKLKDYPNKERKIWLNDPNATFERGVAKVNISSDDVLDFIDYPSYFQLTKQPLPANKSSILQKLLDESLIIASGKMYSITNLGAILFAKKLSAFPNLKRKAVRIIIYDGKNKVKTKRELVGNKGYASGFKGLIDYTNDHLPSTEIIDVVFRHEVKVYPQLAIRELVANAIIHQDFSEKGTSPTIEIFDDRVEISNPGEPLIDVLRFIDHVPQSRNEELASFMRRINICEERGSGIDKVISTIEESQLPAPRFESSDRFTKVTLFAAKSVAQMEKEDKIRACYQHCCLKYVSNEKMTNTSLRERFRIEEQNYSIASRIIGDTIEAGLIKVSNPENKSKKHMSYIPIWA